MGEFSRATACVGDYYNGAELGNDFTEIEAAELTY